MALIERNVGMIVVDNIGNLVNGFGLVAIEEMVRRKLLDLFS